MMKKTMMKLTVLVCVLGLAACSNPAGGGEGGGGGGTPASGFAGGNGTAGDPYVISTSAQLAFLAEKVNAGTPGYADACFTLTGDLDLNGNEWTAIGTNAHRFKGVFDGVGHVIHGLFIDNPTADYQGLFGFLDGAEISNLGLEGVSIEGKDHIGGIAGYVFSNSSIDNCYSTGDVSGTGAEVGGIAGAVRNSSIKNSYSTGNVSGTGTGTGVGGIAGVVVYSSIDNCYSTGDVSGYVEVGGIAGLVGYSSIDNCYSTGDVSGTTEVGGIAGRAGSSSIANCYSTGDVSGTGVEVGGIAGDVSYDSSIDNCYSTGDVSGPDHRVGGVAGIVYNSSIANCAALNLAVTATTSGVGRVVGVIIGTNTITGNVAWEGMGGTFSNDPDKDGKGITAGAVQDGTGLPDSLKTDPWDYTPGKLPILKNLEGQSNALPVHLVDE
jgi:hypothetical protein